jgi:predicted transcriptional regulator
MPMLLGDLADETSASMRRAAERLTAEVRELGGQTHAPAEQAALRRRTIESARQATTFVVSSLPLAEAMWESALERLREAPFGEDATRLLKGMHGVFVGGQVLCRLPRDLWAEAASLGAAADPAGELDRVQARFAQLAAEARKAIDHRELSWQPADPERLARGLQQAREGKVVSAEEVLRRFRAS